MKTTLLARLEQTIDKWIKENCDKLDWPDFYVHDNLASQMANAAAAVVDASYEGQIEKETQENE
jgi:hypothetical protein